VLSLPPSVRLFVATQPVDGRKGPDSLMALVRDVLQQDPLSGHLFIFFSKRCDRVRIVYWDRNGLAMWTKRMEKGKFAAPWEKKKPVLEWTTSELALFLEGSELVGRMALSPPVWTRAERRVVFR